MKRGQERSSPAADEARHELEALSAISPYLPRFQSAASTRGDIRCHAIRCRACWRRRCRRVDASETQLTLRFLSTTLTRPGLKMPRRCYCREQRQHCGGGAGEENATPTVAPPTSRSAREDGAQKRKSAESEKKVKRCAAAQSARVMPRDKQPELQSAARRRLRRQVDIIQRHRDC